MECSYCEAKNRVVVLMAVPDEGIRPYCIPCVLDFLRVDGVPEFSGEGK